MRKLQNLSILVFILLNSCVEPYSIKSIGTNELLVVDGFISTDVTQHQVTISKTSAINNAQFIPETGAQVYIKDGHGVTITLTEATPGHYLTPTISGLVGNTYALYITTQNGRKIVSSEVTLRDTPQIDSVYAIYSPAANGQSGAIKIYLDSDDPTQQTNFFRWDYIETYEVQTPSESEFIWLGDNNVMFRTIPVSTCYPSDTSSNVLIQSTQGLSDNKVTAQLIQTIPDGSISMSVMYSILIKQYSLSENSYLYWKTLQKINQSQGTLYDTQPGTVIGNISSVSDNQTVLGYFDASVVQQKRTYFSPRDFYGSGFSATQYESSCTFITPIQVPSDQIGTFYAQPGNQNYDITGATGAGPSTLFLVPKVCCDCTNLGTNVKPPFWP